MASSSFAGANRQPIPTTSSSSGRARRLSQFPPVPKSVRVVSVFSEPQPSSTPGSPMSPQPEAGPSAAWPLWLLGFIVILGLAAMAFARAQFWNQPGN